MAARISKGLVWALLAVTVAVLAAAVSSGPFGPGGPLDTVECFVWYVLIMQVLLIYFAVCVLRCDNDECKIVCVRRFAILVLILQIAFVSCVLINIWF
jgi:hypothetical protein